MQKSIPRREEFQVLKVEKDMSRMSVIFGDKIDCVENGKVFFEFRGEEDLLYYREVAIMEKDSVIKRVSMHIPCMLDVVILYKV